MTLRLNLGCGNHKLDGYLNVDSQPACSPDQVVDLENTPWPWEDNSVDEIFMSHVLEHLGASTDIYLGIIKELYRVSKPDAIITIIVPHPRSDNFLADPTHVRPITGMGLSMFDQSLNRQSVEAGASTTPLGLYLGVNLVLEETKVNILEPWDSRINSGSMSEDDVRLAVNCFYNVIGDTTFVLRVVK